MWQFCVEHGDGKRWSPSSRASAECTNAANDAIDALPRGPVRLLAEKCWGCGICRTGCTAQAISLVDRREVPAVATLW